MFENFYGRNVRIILISVCQWQAFPANANDVGKARSLSSSRAPERCFTQVGEVC
jgi:hypothetical protein